MNTLGYCEKCKGQKLIDEHGWCRGCTDALFDPGNWKPHPKDTVIVDEPPEFYPIGLPFPEKAAKRVEMVILTCSHEAGLGSVSWLASKGKLCIVCAKPGVPEKI